MDVDLIFKIAAIGILVAVLNLLLVRSGREGAGHDDHAGGADRGADDAGAADQRPVRPGEDAVLPVTYGAGAAFDGAVPRGALLAVLLQRTGPDMALLLALAVCGAGLALLLEPLGALRDFGRRPPRMGRPAHAAVCAAGQDGGHRAGEPDRLRSVPGRRGERRGVRAGDGGGRWRRYGCRCRCFQAAWELLRSLL